MKSFFNCLILCGLVVLVGCSGGSPKPPTVTPPPGGDVWLITSLVSSNDNPLVNTAVLVTATVTMNGSPAADGTQVEFLANGGVFIANGLTQASVVTTGGQASITFGATDAGAYIVQARVKTVTSQVQVAYRNPDTSGGLQIWSINPTLGSYAGGETVVLSGKGIESPIEVYFTVQGRQYQAIIDQVVPSIPLSSAGTITLRTPLPTAADTNQTSSADVRVVVRVGTPEEESQSYPSAFTFISNSVIVGDPTVFGIEPYWGRSSGGEIVTILGLDFAVDVTKELVKNFDEVYFLFDGQELLAEVEVWSANQIEVVTPRFSLTPLSTDQNAGIKLTRLDGDDVIKSGVFIVKSDIAQPVITGLSPTAGPIDGGTLVTITGHGFEIPMQVLFGTLEATGVQVINDQTPADNDIITCLTPDYSQQSQLPPLPVSVTVTNLQTGNTAQSPGFFTFGDVLYVGQANPTEGQIGDLLTLFGAGFEDPLTVWFSSNIEFDVISVTGTEITLRSPPSLPPTCADRTGNFRVVLNESNFEAQGGTYTLLGDDPTVTSVSPIFVNEFDFGNAVTPDEIDIYGVRFADDLLVLINGFTMLPDQVTVMSPEHIHVTGIPAPNDFGLVFDSSSCTTDTGLAGIREVPTPVNVTVRNLPLGCENTLNSTLVYVPEDQTCVVAPVLQVGLNTNFPTTAAGSCSAAEPLVLFNNGGGDLEVQTLFLQGDFFFDAGGTNQTAGPLSIPSFSSNATLNVYFCPEPPADGLPRTGVLAISSNDPNSPTILNLSGLEGTPPTIGTAPYGDGETWTFPAVANPACTATEVLTITNTGISDLTIQSVASSDTQFPILNLPPVNTVLPPAGSYGLQVQFCPAGAGPVSATLTINHDADNEPNPIQINLAGTGL